MVSQLFVSLIARSLDSACHSYGVVVSSSSRDSYTPTRHCYYHGHVVGDPNSWVALDTCHGLSGVIHAHQETFAITPDMFADAEGQEQQDDDSRRRTRGQSALRHMHSLSATPEEQHEKMTHDHIVYRLHDYDPLKTVCGVTEADEQAHEHGQQAVHAAAAAGASSAPSVPAAAPRSSNPPSTTDSTFMAAPLVPGSQPADRRFIEMLVVNDYERYQQHGENTEHDSLALSQQGAHTRHT
jgi:hypothetical protein